MRRILCMLGLCLTLLLCACGAAPAESTPPAEEAAATLRIVVASDLHYLSQALTDNGPLFQRLVAQGDGKLMLDIETITEAFIDQMLAERPDLVVLSGDLSYNGEYQSHLDLTEKLRRLTDSGIPVLVIPGNHDVRRSTAFRFSGESYEAVGGASGADFEALYAEFGRQQARSVDEESGSYVCVAAPDLWIVMLDTNTNAVNRLSAGSLAWLDAVLTEAERSGARVITVSHQNLLAHSPLFVFGYQIANADELAALLEKHGVLLNLSGHMHIQHRLDGPVPEILTSPLSLVPCRYGLLSWDGEALCYEVQSVDVAAWAQRQGRTEEKLLHFAVYAAESFYQSSYRQIEEGFADSGLPPETVARLARCFAEANLAYFTGEAPDRAQLAAELDFWVEAAGESFETAYLRSILEDEAPDPLRAVFR